MNTPLPPWLQTGSGHPDSTRLLAMAQGLRRFTSHPGSMALGEIRVIAREIECIAAGVRRAELVLDGIVGDAVVAAQADGGNVVQLRGRRS